MPIRRSGVYLALTCMAEDKVMSNYQSFRRLLSACCMFLFACSGCDTLGMLGKAGVPGFESYLKPTPEAIAFERNKREEFVLNRSHNALFWLLAHRIESGMRLSEVEQVLGEAGEDVSDQSYQKSQQVHQQTDDAYKWGPDTEGKSVVLFFRDGKLANFNPKDYRLQQPLKSE